MQWNNLVSQALAPRTSLPGQPPGSCGRWNQDPAWKPRAHPTALTTSTATRHEGCRGAEQAPAPPGAPAPGSRPAAREQRTGHGWSSTGTAAPGQRRPGRPHHCAQGERKGNRGYFWIVFDCFRLPAPNRAEIHCQDFSGAGQEERARGRHGAFTRPSVAAPCDGPQPRSRSQVNQSHGWHREWAGANLAARQETRANEKQLLPGDEKRQIKQEEIPHPSGPAEGEARGPESKHPSCPSLTSTIRSS